MSPLEKSILIVASEAETRAVLRQWLEKRGMVVHEAGNLEAAMRAIFRWPGLAGVICDQRLPDGGAMNFLHWMREQLFPTPFLLIVGRDVRVREGKSFDLLHTPVSAAALHEGLSRVAGLDLPEIHGKSHSPKARRKSKGRRAAHSEVA